jgi:hypothetical protein
MKRLKLALALAVAIAVISLGLVVYLPTKPISRELAVSKSGPEENAFSYRDAAGMAPRQQPEMPGPATSAAVGRPENKLAPLRKMLGELADSNNYKRTYETAKVSPESGGLFIARLIGQRCDQLQDVVQKSLSTAESLPQSAAWRAQDAGQRLYILCAGLISEDLDLQSDLGSLLSGSARQKDPLLNLESQYIGAIDSGDRSRIEVTLLKIVSLPTPDLFLALLLPPKGEALYYDGKTYQLGSSGSSMLIDAAKLLVACDIWGRCGGPSDYMVLRNCALRGICSVTYAEQVRQALGDEKRFAEAQAIAKSMANAIRSQNMALFVP